MEPLPEASALLGSSPAQAEPAARPAAVAAGRPVRLHGLKTAELNGCVGFAQSREPSGRWGVRLLRGGRPVAIHARNLQPLQKPFSDNVRAPERSLSDWRATAEAEPYPPDWYCTALDLAPFHEAPGAPVVSVLLPTHKRTRLLSYALGLIAEQTYPGERIEIVIVEDGPCSLDPLAASDAFMHALDRIVYVHMGTELVPAGIKRNVGVWHSAGQIIAHWEDGDYFGPGRLRAQVEPLIQGSAALTLLPPTHWFAEESSQFYSVLENLGGHLSTLCYHRDLWRSQNELLQYGATNHGDELFFYRNVLESPGVAQLDLEPDIVPWILVQHRASGRSSPPAGKCEPCEAPGFLPISSLDMLQTLRKQRLVPASTQSVIARAWMELGFLDVYASREDLIHLPRRFLMQLTDALQQVPENSGVRHEMFTKLSDLICDHATAFDAASLVLVSWCCSTAGLLTTDDVFPAACAALLAKLQENPSNFAASDLSLFIWLMGRRFLRDTPLLQSMVTASLRILDQFNPVDLANLTTGLARLQMDVEPDAIVAVINRAAELSQEFPLDDWQRLGWAFAHLKAPGTLDLFALRFVRASVASSELVHWQFELLGAAPGMPCLHPLCSKPPVLVMDNFVSPVEVAQLEELMRPLWEKMPPDAKILDLLGMSQADHSAVRTLQHRAEALAGLPQGHAEHVRIWRHRPNDDCIPSTEAITGEDVWEALSLPGPDPREKKWGALRGGQRVAVVLVYLRPGGQFLFEKLGIEARPPCGGALVWPLVKPTGYVETRWAACEGPASTGGCAAWIGLRSEPVPMLGPPRGSLSCS